MNTKGNTVAVSMNTKLETLETFLYKGKSCTNAIKLDVGEVIIKTKIMKIKKMCSFRLRWQYL